MDVDMEDDAPGPGEPIGTPISSNMPVADYDGSGAPAGGAADAYWRGDGDAYNGSAYGALNTGGAGGGGPLHRIDGDPAVGAAGGREDAEVKEVVVVIDGANVALSHGRHEVRSPVGIAAAVDFFRARGCRCFAFVPAYWLRRKKRPDDVELDLAKRDAEALAGLQQLERDGYIVLTPPQDEDDPYQIAYAQQYDGFVVTNDMFRDWIAKQPTEEERARLRSWVSERVLSYAFVGDEFVPRPAGVAAVDAALASVGEAPPDARDVAAASAPVDERTWRVLHSVTVPLVKAQLDPTYRAKVITREQYKQIARDVGTAATDAWVEAGGAESCTGMGAPEAPEELHEEVQSRVQAALSELAAADVRAFEAAKPRPT